MNYFALTSALTIALLSTACSSRSSQKQNEAHADTLRVSVVTPRVDTVTVAESFSATVESYVRNNIAPQVPNRIKAIHVEVGQSVRKGQLLATLDNAQLVQLELKMKKSKTDLDRIEELYQMGGISKSDWENARMAYDVDASSYRNLSENTRLVSPIAGVITARNYDSGDLYSPQLPLLVVEQISPLKIKIHVSEKYFALIHKGMPVEVKSDVFPQETFPGVVALTYPSVDPSSRTFAVEINLKNSDNRLRPGMYAHVTMELERKALLLVPDVAVRTLQGTGEKMVYLYKDGKAVQQAVSLGTLIGNRYVVEKGVSEKDQVITSGLNRIKSGMTVEKVNQ